MRISLYVSTQLKNGSDIKKMPYAREASEALGTQTGRKSYHARQESMWVQDGKINEKLESTWTQSMQPVHGTDVAVMLAKLD